MLRHYIMLPLLSLLMITINFVKPKKIELVFSKIDNMRDYSIYFFWGVVVGRVNNLYQL